MVQVLLDYGVDVNAQNSMANPIRLCFLNGHRNDARVARLLIAHGADPNSRTIDCGRIEIVRLLIEHGANTPLDVARHVAK
ncbi:hypothetical protein BGY98DRAFT_1013514 [Russula aff. rugulosa BPL654]|nr:hypothetical protein BGY98DRAFT_1013514 [Russula aff. rugulosa BPL654]